MCHLWKSKTLLQDAKLALYERGVLSVLMYGCEAWVMDDRLQRMLRGATAIKCREPAQPSEAVQLMRSRPNSKSFSIRYQWF